MTRPEKVNLTCKHCGHQWLEATISLLAMPIVVYRDEETTEKRRLPCPNCGRGVIVDVPKTWLNDE